MVLYEHLLARFVEPTLRVLLGLAALAGVGEVPDPWCPYASEDGTAYGCVGVVAQMDQPRVWSLDVLGGVAEDLTTRPTMTPVVPGVWIPVGSQAVRVRIDLHEGSASYEFFGGLDVRCADGRVVAVDIRERGLELGEVARLFTVGGASTFALSVRGQDGGEGHDDVWLNTITVDAAALCAGTETIAGPLPGRSVGP